MFQPEFPIRPPGSWGKQPPHHQVYCARFRPRGKRRFRPIQANIGHNRMAANPKSVSGERLDSWKQIAAFFDRAERTVKRWENERGLPVHRVPGGSRSAVFAYTSELAEWLEGSKELETDEASPDSNGSRRVTETLPTEAPVSAPTGLPGRN